MDTGGGKPVVDAGGSSSSAITLSADWITLAGFGVINSGDSGVQINANHNTITGNTISNSTCGGIVLLYSFYNTITGNTFVNDGIFVDDSFKNTVENNTVNGKSLVYLEDASNITVTDSGQVVLVNCHNVRVENQDLGNTSLCIVLLATEDSVISNNIVHSSRGGIYLGYSCNNNITGNIASNNEAGIILSDYSNNNIIASNTLSGNEDGIALGYFCDYNSVTGNTICNNNDGGIVLAFTSNNTITHNTVCNNEDGIYLRLTSDNKIYLNDFMNNSVNVDSMKSANIWDSPETIAYQYDSSNFTNYLGNFWDDYSGFDADNDGIGDTFYSIASDKDNYPLMQPWENYFVTVSAFDTCPGTYPSLMGTHTGTITPSHNLTVSKLYTYPCAGTGGHTESIKLYGNGTLIANGAWTGYQSDGHNITINPSVILQAGHTYNYTIVTGSYPQILHTTSKEVTGGTITCSSFVDANGNIYTDWIPAIRLG